MPGLTLRIAALDDRSDDTVLAAYSREQDTTALATLIHRHGGLILGVCRRMIRDRHLAEDAFQAVCLILARKARDIRPAGRLSAWLYGVSVRVARRARAMAARQAHRERPMTQLPTAMTHDPEPDDLATVIDEAIEALPETLRSAVILCELDGRSRAEAAKILGIPEGTLSSRLAAARKKLAITLRGRGLVLPIGALVLSASVSPKLLAQAMKSLSAETTLTPTIHELVRGGLAMSLVRKWNLGVVLMMLVCGGGALGLAQNPKAPQPPAAAVEEKDPVWERFKTICGDTKESRAMFEEMMGDEKEAKALREADETDEKAYEELKRMWGKSMQVFLEAKNFQMLLNERFSRGLVGPLPDAKRADEIMQDFWKTQYPPRILFRSLFLATRPTPKKYQDTPIANVIYRDFNLAPMNSNWIKEGQHELLTKLMLACAKSRPGSSERARLISLARTLSLKPMLPTIREWLSQDRRENDDSATLVEAALHFLIEFGDDRDRLTALSYQKDTRNSSKQSSNTISDIVVIRFLQWKNVRPSTFGYPYSRSEDIWNAYPFLSDERRRESFARVKPWLDEIEKELKKSTEK